VFFSLFDIECCRLSSSYLDLVSGMPCWVEREDKKRRRYFLLPGTARLNPGR